MVFISWKNPRNWASGMRALLRGRQRAKQRGNRRFENQFEALEQRVMLAGTTAVDDNVVTVEDTPLVFSEASILANDIGGPNTDIISFTQPANGMVTSDGTDFTFTPNMNFSGSTQFNYTIEDPDTFGVAGTQTVVASDAAASDLLGFSVAIDGDRMVVGAARGDGVAADSGAAYVYQLSGGTWTEVAKLTASDGAALDLFGWSVSIDGDTIVVGARSQDTGATNAGAAYVFEDSGGNTWLQTGKLQAASPEAGALFGYDVSVDGTLIAVGSLTDDTTAGADAGSVTVFDNAGAGVFNLVTTVEASDAAAGDQFGISVDLSGTSLIVGSRHDDDNGTQSGSAYIYTIGVGSATEDAKLTASDGAAGDEFGFDVAIDGSTALIGARSDDDFGGNSGSAYIFRNNMGWAEDQKLHASNATVGDLFGTSVDVNETDGLILVGASQVILDSGMGFLFEESMGTYAQTQMLTIQGSRVGDNFGRTVALSGTNLAFGASGDDNAGAGAGTASVIEMGPETDIGTVFITVTPGNDPPVVSGGSTVNYTEGQAGVLVGPTITVTDMDNNLGTGTFDATLTNPQTGDELSIFTSQQIQVVGTDIRFQGNSFATLTSTLPGNSVTATLNAGASNSAVQALARAVRFANTTENPSTTPRSVTFTVTDADAASDNDTSTVNITVLNDAPTLGNVDIFGPAVTAGGAAVTISTTITAVDPEDNFDGGLFRVLNLVNGDSGDSFSLTGSYSISGSDVLFGAVVIGTVRSNAFNAFQVDLNANATSANVEGLYRAVQFQATAVAGGTRDIRFQLWDGDSAVSNSLTTTLTVT